MHPCFFKNKSQLISLIFYHSSFPPTALAKFIPLHPQSFSAGVPQGLVQALLFAPPVLSP